MNTYNNDNLIDVWTVFQQTNTPDHYTIHSNNSYFISKIKSVFSAIKNAISKLLSTITKAETKISVLLAHWGVETVTTAIVVTALAASGIYTIAASVFAFYLCTTYALFSLMINTKA